MMHRAFTIGASLALGLTVGALTLAGCEASSGTTGHGTGTAGTGTGSGAAGTSSGTGAAGTTSPTGAAGTTDPTGAAGTSSGTGAAGTTSPTGAAGTNGGAAGTGAAGTGAGGTSAAGTAGTTGGAAGTTAGGRPSGPSAGCNMPPPANEPLGKDVSHTITITGMDPKYAAYVNRTYCTKMPANYDPSKPYPVVFYGGGCGAFGCEGSSFSGRTDIILVQANISHANTGLVPKEAAPGCFQMGRVTTPDSPEASYFDQVMDQVEKTYCTDKGRIYVAGTSSGAWLANTLACQRGGRVRGAAADSGGIGFDHGTCKGGAAVMEMPGDSANTADGMGNQIGAAVARDLFIKLNGCSTTPTKMTFGNDSCDFYGGCDSPVAWCNVGGGHQSGNAHLSPTGFPFWTMLK